MNFLIIVNLDIQLKNLEYLNENFSLYSSQQGYFAILLADRKDLIVCNIIMFILNNLRRNFITIIIIRNPTYTNLLTIWNI